jgi:hypothetical protein
MKLRIWWTTLAFLAGCGDDLPLSPSECTGSCVLPFWTDIENFAMVVGDTVRLRAHPVTVEGHPVVASWSVAMGPLAVNSTGLVEGHSPGRGFIRASAQGDPGYVALADIRVIHPDTSSQPFITQFRDPVTGAFFSRRQEGWTDRDSMDVIINYVLGNTTVTDGPPTVIFEVRGDGRSQCACLVFVSDAIPLPDRGKTGFVTYRFRPRERDAAGLRRLPPGIYDLFVIIPLADGRRLGSETGYPFIH